MTVFTVLALAVFISVVGALYFLQERLIFPSPVFVAEIAGESNFHPVFIHTPDGETLAAFHHPATEGEATILIFHGNAGAAIYQKEKGTVLAKAGFGVLLVEYRGYPGSTGTPTEAGLLIDGRAAYDFVRKHTKQPIGLHGTSLGAGVAVSLAAEREVFAVVLVSPFDSLMAVAQRRFPWLPVSLLLKHKFRSDQIIGKINAPILILHGSRDRVIPIEHGRKLMQLAGQNAEFIEIDGAGHNNLSKFGTTRIASRFLRKSLAPLLGNTGK